MRVASVIRVNTPKRLLLLYHFVLALLAGFLYRFPSRAMTVIGVTGTNGKSTVVEMLRHIFEEDSRRVASISSIRFQIGKHEWRNDLKMTMPGRFFLQRFLADARKAKCSLVILEVTSEGIAQFRHRFIAFDAAVLTNLTPEHIESHGSFKKYREAKAQLFRRTPVHILNGDDKNIDYFSNIAAKKRVVYREKDFPSNMALHLPGRFNRRNAVAAVKTSALFGVDEKTAYRALGRIKSIPGRLERIAKHPFTVYVDYAHTPDALMQVYKTLRPPGGSGESHGFICVLGSAGGGRDIWKREELGRIADSFCDAIILTNEDPYDENPLDILKDIAKGIQSKKPHTILDRRAAIRQALTEAKEKDVVIITGKGSEPWMMVARGGKIPWDDRAVVREEMGRLF